MSAALSRAEVLRGLHVLADDAPRWKRDPVEQAEAACAGGASVVQLRAKSAVDREALSWAHEIRLLTRRSGALFVVNDRFDLALASDADGVHLGQEDLPPARVRSAVGDRLVIGRSTHTEAQLAEARAEPVDYLAFGPIFGTRSKASPYGPRGLTRLARVVKAAAPLPLVAIGGIDGENLGEVVAAGAAAAVLSAVAGAEDPEAATRELARRLRDAARR